jgi:hypothetical protein
VLFGGFCGGEGGCGGVAVGERVTVAVGMGGEKGADRGEGFGGVEDEVGDGGHGEIVWGFEFEDSFDAPGISLRLVRRVLKESSI